MMYKYPLLLFTLIICNIALSCAGDTITRKDPLVFEEKDRITIINNEFTVNGRRIWINGVNTPWDRWNDFGGGYNDAWWDRHFAELH